MLFADKLRQCFFHGSFKSEPADHFVNMFLSDEAAVNDVLLPVDHIFGNTLREILVLLVQLKHLSCLLFLYGRCFVVQLNKLLSAARSISNFLLL